MENETRYSRKAQNYFTKVLGFLGKFIGLNALDSISILGDCEDVFMKMKTAVEQ